MIAEIILFCYSFLNGFLICVCSSVVERCPDKTEVEGPIPSRHTNLVDTNLLRGAVRQWVDESDLSRSELRSATGIPSTLTIYISLLNLLEIFLQNILQENLLELV